MIYEYECPRCNKYKQVIKSLACYKDPEICDECQVPMGKLVSIPALLGMRDSFGIGKEFTTPDGKLVDTWTKWEREGYSDPKDSPNLSNDTKARIKEKEEKVKNKMDAGQERYIKGGI